MTIRFSWRKSMLELEQEESFISSSSWLSPAPSGARALAIIGCPG